MNKAQDKKPTKATSLFVNELKEKIEGFLRTSAIHPSLFAGWTLRAHLNG